MSKDDLRLRYIVTNKEIATAATLREMALRAFAASFCDDDNVGAAEVVVSALAQALIDLAAEERLRLLDELDDEDAQPPETPAWVVSTEAEHFYYNTVVRLYREAGFDQKYAEEAASWPDVLNLNTRYQTDLLTDFAKLEVGHDLLVSDYIRAAAANNYFKTEPLSAGAEQSDGSAQ